MSSTVLATGYCARRIRRLTRVLFSAWIVAALTAATIVRADLPRGKGVAWRNSQYGQTNVSSPNMGFARAEGAQNQREDRTICADSPPNVESSQVALEPTHVMTTTSAAIPAELAKLRRIAPEELLKIDFQTAEYPLDDTVAVVPPVNDLCTGAISVPVPSSTAGTTVGAFPDTDFPTCLGNTGIASPGVWYALVGTGHIMSAKTCNPATTFDARLSVYCPNCAAPVCVTSNGYPCHVDGTFQLSVSWCSQFGQTYFILVQGYNGSEFGPFQLDVADNGTPCSPPASCGSPPTCDVTCSPTQLSENEANCGLPTDTINGGCNYTPNRFSPITCGQSYCGTGGYDGITRDTDWYKLVLGETTPVSWTVAAEFYLLTGVIETQGIDSCAHVNSFRTFAVGAPCTTVSVTTVLPAGTWYLFAAPDFSTPIPCGKEYTVTLTCGEPGIGACCNLLIGSCAENLPSNACSGTHLVWTRGARCVDVVCDAVTGACCELLSGSCADGVPSFACFGTHQKWTEGANCVDVACDAVTGACCAHDPFGACTDGITRAACDCPACEWLKLGSCSDLDCPHNAIPTVGEWGLVVLTLLLLTGAKVLFSRRTSSA